ncbi:beta-N-acetylglucosaminidase domain-containing protein [Microbacterium sp. A94]|uniref:beta-N-acetylglucosaminidase domain-containing protein n=1 Tax=Microbacterium sp. A94 TaxID=3450717 RepID=UPI003F43BD86
MNSIDLASSPLAASARITVMEGMLDAAPPWKVALADEREGLGTLGPAAVGPSRFQLRIDAQGRAEIQASDLPALARVETLLRTAKGPGPSGIQQVVDRANVKVRAVLECFYGRLWTAQERASVVAGAARRGANAYVFGPSADRGNGGGWREPYAGHVRADLQALTADLRSRGMVGIWRVSPGAPVEESAGMRLGDAAELSLLLAKVQDVRDIGFEKVLIAFDDLTDGLRGDAAAAATRHPLAEAHAAIVNAVARANGADRVIACPTHYWDTAPSRYRTDLAALLEPGVEICWTGPEVISPAVTASEVREVRAQLGRDIWLWDNYPVNDWDLDGVTGSIFAQISGVDNLVAPRRLALAALDGRDPGMVDDLAAYGVNAAINPLMGAIPVQTAMDWAWQGASYDPVTSWRSVVEDEGVDAGALAVLADAAGPTLGLPTTSVGALATASARMIAEAFTSKAPHAAGELENEARRALEAIRVLRAQPSMLVAEVHPWIIELGRQAVFASLAAQVLGGWGDRRALVVALRDALGRNSLVSMCANVPRAAAEVARSMCSSGVPDLPS